MCRVGSWVSKGEMEQELVWKVAVGRLGLAPIMVGQPGRLRKGL